ncbi:MAG: GNAT family N-acetyltransferase [Arachnia propionica]|uniref:GNAT family N-acetyltransferase n=1 Tax=Arachnia propionica TaxID=1750 RepID=UPI0026F63010|nr:GNAT family N-acetyltransferase [Arachnia propionica]
MPVEDRRDHTMPDPHLRPLRSGDASRVLEAFAEPDMSRQGHVEDLADARCYIERLCDPDGVHRAFAMVGEDDELLGLVAVAIDGENRNGWFFYWTHPEGRGRGWTGRAAATIAHHALTVLGLERLELGYRANNPASGGVARAAGFVQEGLERGKFLADGERLDVVTCARLLTDPAPTTPLLRLNDR